MLLATVSLAGCVTTNQPASVSGGECKLIPRAQYAVVGQTQYDQDFVDEVVIAGVASCGYPRPAPRPENFGKPDTAAPVARSPAPKKPGILSRARARVSAGVAKVRSVVRRAPGVVSPANAAPVSLPVPPPAPPPRPIETFDNIVSPPPPPPKPSPPAPARERHAIDDLLDPPK